MTTWPGRPLSLRAAGIRVVLLDIEGTTTPVAFVHDVLFPYARTRTRAWLTARPSSDPELQQIVRGLRDELASEGTSFDAESWDVEAGRWNPDAVVSRVFALMDEDRKSGALKALQGRVWEDGYARGELKGEVYPDVPDALERWTAAGIGVGIFSSGSVLAQRLLFTHSDAGDLTRFLRWHFDTAVGTKIQSSSYRRIVQTLDVDAGAVLFISDVVRELDAAREAGLPTVLCVRPPASSVPPDLQAAHPSVTSFKEIVVKP